MYIYINYIYIINTPSLNCNKKKKKKPEAEDMGIVYTKLVSKIHILDTLKESMTQSSLQRCHSML